MQCSTIANRQRISTAFQQHLELVIACRDLLIPQIVQVAAAISGAIDRGNRIWLCGNGGSAADAQHMAAEFIGRFKKERRPLPAVALTTDTSVLTAIGNDYSFDQIFSRQVAGLADEGDIVIGISTSGRSRNIVKAIIEAKTKGCVTVAMTGKGGGELVGVADYCISVPSDVTARVQEIHIFVAHLLCEQLDSAF